MKDNLLKIFAGMTIVIFFVFSCSPSVDKPEIEGPDIDITQDTTDLESGVSTIDYGITSGKIDLTYTLKNSGDLTLHLTGKPAVSLSGDATFTVQTQPATSVDPGNSTTFVIRFLSDLYSGKNNSLVTIKSDDFDEDTFTFNVTGTATS